MLIWLLVACTGLWFAAIEGRRLTLWWWFTGAVTVTLLLTHNISALLGAFVTPAWIGCLWLWQPNRRALLLLGAAALSAAALTAFFWLPALTEIALVQADRIHSGDLDFRNWFLTWPGYHSIHWGLQERSSWTRGFPFDLHLVFPHQGSGPPPGSLWQGVLFLATLIGFGLTATPLGRRRAACLLRPSPIPQALRLTCLTVGFGLLLALACYSQLFDWALPLWERLPPLRAVQFPFRLLIPAGYGLALAAGGALTLWVLPHRRVWVAISLLVVGLGIAGIGGRAISLTANSPQDVPPEAGGLYVGAEEVGSAEFLPRTAHFTTWHEDEARGRWLYERMFPEAAWLGGRVTVWHGTLAIRHLSGGSLWTRADVTVAGDTPAVLAFHQLAFAGWRAWVDDQPVPATPAPWIETQAIQPGFLLVTVPPGDHRVAIRFGPSGSTPGRRHHLLARLPRPRRLGLIASHRRTTLRQRLALRGASLVIALGVHRGQRAARASPVATANGSPPAAHHRDHRDRRPTRRPSDSALANGHCVGSRPLPGRPLSHGTGAGSSPCGTWDRGRVAG